MRERALKYHSRAKAGKIEINTTKPAKTQEELSLAYSPGVAYPCLEIAKNPDLAYKYTLKSNLVAVISNGSAVLGLGDIGAIASKPVMEGKALLFKKFAGIDSIDIEIDESNPEKLIEHIRAISPTFGGINLEDIKAPECFEIESRLKEILDIPIMHDDQHGTAIITGAGLLNALELTSKKIEDIKIVILGAGAAGVSCAKIYKSLGAKNIIMVDSRGIITKDRENLSRYKKEFAISSNIKTLKEAMEGADMLLGLSRANTITKEMVKSMADNPILFTLANPNPEISPEDVKATRDDAIIATGRSDYPNQVNNVLAFPGIFRAALDTKSKEISEEMKISASKALANLAKEQTPKAIEDIYKRELKFSKEYIIPTPFDKRVVVAVALSVAKSAIESNSARVKLDLDEYRDYLENLEL